MREVFDPLNLRAEASLNRTVLPAVRGVPSELVGWSGIDLLGGAALRDVAPDPPGSELVGLRVAALLAALRLGDRRSGLGMAPTRWRQQYLSYWGLVREVTLGGGMAQRFGPAAAKAANRALGEAGIGQPTVQVPEHAALLPMIGAARSVAPSTGALVLDLGHTSVKRGIARYDSAGRLTKIEMWSPVAVERRQDAPDEVIAFVLTTVEASLRAAGEIGGIVASVASYVTPGGAVGGPPSYYHPLAGPGSTSLHALVAHRFRGAAELRFVHDGTAAAAAMPSTTPAAAITLGTSVGLGFAPMSQRVALSPEFTVVVSGS